MSPNYMYMFCFKVVIYDIVFFFRQNMPSYKFTYFNRRGRAEVTRYMFAMNDVEYKNIYFFLFLCAS